jgi:hypothetical protein
MYAGFMGVKLSKVFLRTLLDAFLRWDAGTTVFLNSTEKNERHIPRVGYFSKKSELKSKIVSGK